MKRISSLILFLLVSLMAFAKGGNDFELNVTWNLKYGILRETGATRGERPEGFISDFIIREDETSLELRNFYCAKAIQQTVCPVIFFDRNGKIISYVKFQKTDGPTNYSVDIPKNCYKYQLSTEYIKKYGPVVMCNRKNTTYEIKAKETAMTRAEQLMMEKGISSIKSGLKARKVMYSMPVDTSYRQVVYTKGRRISAVMEECEKAFTGRKIKIVIDQPMNLEQTDVLSARKNSYVVESRYPVTGLSQELSGQVINGILRVRRPSSQESFDCVMVDGQKYTLASRYDEEEPGTFPTFRAKSISLKGSEPDGYVYTLSVGKGHGITKSALVKLYTEWISIYAKVVAVSQTSVSIKTDTKLSDFIVSKDYPVSLYNVYNQQSDAKAGQFWYDSQYIYCKLIPGSSRPKSVRVAVNSKLFRIANSTGITFSGVRFEHTAASKIFSYVSQGLMEQDGVISVERSSNIHFLDCEFEGIGDYCVSFKNNTTGCSVQGCYFHEIGTGGIIVNNPKMPWEKGYKKDDTGNIMIYSNIIRGYGKVRPCGVGILAGFGNDISIISNHVFDGYYTAINLGWGWNQYHLNRNNYVAGNVVHHIMKFLLCDGGGIYTLSDWDGGSIECNEVYCVNTRSRRDCALGIYHDQGSANILDYRNSVYACDVANGSCYKNGWVLENNYGFIGAKVLEERSAKDVLTSHASGNKMHQTLKEGLEKPALVDYSGRKIPVFKSKYADKTSLSDEYIEHYRKLYNELSLNRNNPYFR